MSIDDTELILRAQAGDIEAYEEVMGLHIRHLRAFLAVRCPASHLVEELAQESFIFAYENLEQFTAGTNFRSWLLAIARNKLRAEVQRFSREQLNKAKLAERMLLNRFNHEPERENDEVVALESCLRELPDHIREIIHMRYHDNLSSEEMAQRTGRTQEWVRVNLFRARKLLKTCMESRMAQEDS